jgi:hypothetical protein
MYMLLAKHITVDSAKFLLLPFRLITVSFTSIKISFFKSHLLCGRFSLPVSIWSSCFATIQSRIFSKAPMILYCSKSGTVFSFPTWGKNLCLSSYLFCSPCTLLYIDKQRGITNFKYVELNPERQQCYILIGLLVWMWGRRVFRTLWLALKFSLWLPLSYWRINHNYIKNNLIVMHCH